MTPGTPSSAALFLGGCMTLVSLGVSTGAQAEGFIDDSTLSLNLRNFYINRNFVDTDYPQSKGEEWTQSFILNFQSGYTPGPVGFGVDALGDSFDAAAGLPPVACTSSRLSFVPSCGRAPDLDRRLGLWESWG